MSAHLLAKSCRAAAVATALIAIGVAAQETQLSKPDAAPAGMTPPDTNANRKSEVPVAITPEQARPATAQAPTSVEEVLKMMDAGVSKDVIKAYVENSRSDYVPTAQDLITLKQHGVPDEISTVLVKRSAEVHAQKPQSGTNPIAPMVLGPGDQDAESYSYFQRYYLFPRTLAYVYDRLGGSYAPGFPSYYPSMYPSFAPGYGYVGPFGPWSRPLPFRR